MLEGEPVIAVTGSGQKIRPPLASLPLNALMAQTALGSEISLLKHGLSYSPHLLFFPPSRSQPHSLLHELLTQTCEVFVAISECLWRTIYREVKHENLF